MYLSRAQGSSHGSQGMKFSIPEACDKIKEEINNLHHQYNNLKMDYEKVVQEKNEMQRHNAMYYEITAGLNVEMHRQSELAKRLVAIIGNVMPFLSQEHQTQVAAAIERAKQVSTSDINNIMTNSDDKFSKLPNGGFGFPTDNMDVYKLMASSGMMPPLPGMPPSSGSKPSVSTSSNGPSMLGSNSSNPASNAAANFLAQNPAALAQAMASFASMGPGSDEKQRTAAAVAMAAFAAASAGMPPNVQNPSPAASLPQASNNLPNMPPGLSTSQQQLFASMAAAGQMDPTQLATLIAAMGGSVAPPSSLGTGSVRPPSISNLPPDEKRRKLDREDEYKQDPDVMVDDHNNSRTSFKARRSPNIENGDNKTDLSFSIGQNRSRTSTPNNMNPMNDGPMTPGASQRRKPPQASTPNSRPTSTNSPHIGNMPTEYPPRNVSNPGCGSQVPQMTHDGSSRGHSPALSSSSAPSSSGFKNSKQDLTQNGSNSTPPLNSNIKPALNGVANGPMMDASYRMNKAPYSFHVSPSPDGQMSIPTPVPLTPEMFVGPGLPRGLRIHGILDHGEVVCAVTMNPSLGSLDQRRTIFTGGRGAVKMWDAGWLDEGTHSPNSINGGIESDSETSNGHRKKEFGLGNIYKDCLSSLDCLPKDSYIRSIKLSKDGKTLIVGGESNILSIWGLNGQTPYNRGVLPSNATACYALTLSPDGRLCYSCTSEGQICIWDVCNQSLVRQFQGHADGASCVDLYEDQLWTGGLDKTVHCWDIRSLGGSMSDMDPSPTGMNGAYPLYNFTFPSQVFSLGFSGEWLAVGLEKRLIEMISPGHESRYQLSLHENCVLSLKFAHNRQWFVSTGKDHFVNAWRTPFGANLCQMKENSSVLSCDLSSDDRFLITGSGEMRATIYDVMY